MSATPQSSPAVGKPLLYALGGVVVLALIAVFVVLPLLNGDDGTADGSLVVAGATDEPGVVAGVPPVVEPTVEPTDDLGSNDLPPIVETFEVFSARDPFQQLVVESSGDVAVVGDETSDGATPAPTATDPVTGDPVTGDPVVDTPPGATTEDGTTVIVEDVFTKDGVEYVLLTANGTAHTLEEGDTFATNWRVEAIDDPCVTLLYGDQARLVCEGESIRK